MITITAEFLIEAVGCVPRIAQVFVPYLEKTSYHFQINNEKRLAAFLAQTAHESFAFARLSENLNYSVEGLLKQFGRHRISEAQARMHGRTPTRPANQKAIANIIYGGEWGKANLGNQEFGDGWRYRGQGLIQITGLDNTRAVTERLRLKLGDKAGVPDFVASPQLLQEPRWAALSSGDYWSHHRLNVLADHGQFDEITRRINPGMAGAVDRQNRFHRIKTVLGI